MHSHRFCFHCWPQHNLSPHEQESVEYMNVCELSFLHHNTPNTETTWSIGWILHRLNQEIEFRNLFRWACKRCRIWFTQNAYLWKILLNISCCYHFLKISLDQALDQEHPTLKNNSLKALDDFQFFVTPTEVIFIKGLFFRHYQVLIFRQHKINTRYSNDNLTQLTWTFSGWGTSSCLTVISCTNLPSILGRRLSACSCAALHPFSTRHLTRTPWAPVTEASVD